MPSTIRSRSSAHSTASRGSSHESFESMSSVPTTVNTSPMPSLVKTAAVSQGHKVDYSYESGDDDLSPATNCCARASVETYASTTASEEDMDLSSESDHSAEYEYQDIPPLPLYRGDIVEPNVRPSNPQDFAKLFPSMNRLSIRHDEFTPDGNMNLRVDTAVPRRRHTVQLFHLRMYDLAKREFSLRRYCRDSGREVCNSKRKYVESASESRPNLQRSMSSAIKTLGGKPAFKRTNSGGSMFSNSSGKRPTTSHSSSSDGDDEFSTAFGHFLAGANDRKSRPLPTNTIKLEFSNYARVDVTRRGGKNAKRYEFEWWGHKYSWKRVIEKHTNVVSFHLLRDGKEGASVAHIVPETRSPNQIRTDDEAGGWVPPCHMWFTDEAVLNAQTDVADVIIATGLMALVDDCIKEKWQVKKSHRIPVPLTNKSYDVGAFMQHVFSRRNSSEQRGASPLQYAKPISAY